MGLRGMGTVIAGALVIWTPPLAAADLALILVNEAYEVADPRPEAPEWAFLADVLNARGYEVYEARNAGRDALQEAIAGFADRLPAADRVIVVYAGHTLHDGARSWAVPVDLAASGRVDAAFGAVGIDLLLDLAAAVPGRSLVAVATDEGGFGGDGAGGAEAALPMMPGLGPVAVPQGVALISGPLAEVVAALTDDVLVEGVSLADALGDTPREIEVAGFLSPDAGMASVPAEAVENAEGAAWLEARRARTAEALQGYLDAYPEGRFAPEAGRMLESLAEAAVNPAEAAETALALDQAERRRIQEQLTVLGQNTRGIDGIFGPGTRAAIAAWQSAAGFEATGFLDATQRERLGTQAAAREAELAAEAEQRRREEEAADAAFWRSTGANGGRTDLRAYLGRYPEGIYAGEARAVLERLEAADRAAAEAEDRAYWDSVEATNTADAYRGYLERYPDGAFATLADERIAALTEAPQRQQAERAAREAEDALGLGSGSRSLIEGQLAALGFDPGRVDGTFDGDTRRAIRQFQSRHGLAVTGYVNGEVMRALIVVSLGLR